MDGITGDERMIDIDRYEGLSEVIDRIINSDEIGVDDLLADSMAIKDGINDLLAEVKRLQERLSMWEDWFKQGAANKMQDGDAYDIIFHNHDTCLSECSIHQEEDCDYKCWICQTKELIE